MGTWKEGVAALVAIGAVALGVAADPARCAAQAAEVTRTEVAPGLWRIDGAVDVVLVQSGPDGVLMVDTGYPFAEAGVRAALREMGATSVGATAKVDLLVNTHWHHAFANHLYAGGRVVAHEAVAPRMQVYNLMGGRVVGPMPASGLPTETFGDTLALRFNGEDVTLRHLPAAHTDGDVVVFFRGSNVVATGDVFVPDIPWIDLDSGGRGQALLEAAELLVEWIPEDATIVPGHGRTATHADLVRWRDMLRASWSEVTAAAAEGTTLRALLSRGLAATRGWRGGVPEPFFIESLFRSVSRDVPEPRTPALEFRNGRWLDEGRFVSKVVHAVDGRLTAVRPAGPVEVVDLEGGWVVPPMAEAHTHAFGRSPAEAGRAYLDAGVFYAMVQDPAARIGDEHRALARDPHTVDIVYTQGVVTPPDGVVADMYRMLAERGAFGDDVSFDALDGDVLFTAGSVEELEAVWPALASRNDDFIKVIVAFSDEIATRRADPQRYSARPPVSSAKPGVNADVLLRLTELAHRAGLRVSAHVETAADFRIAAEAGVDLIAHMPASWQIGEGTGYASGELDPWLLSPEIAGLARRNGVSVITTLRPRMAGDPRAEDFRRVHTHNLSRLRDAGVPLLLGSDGFGPDIVDEAVYLGGLGVLSAAEIFTLLTVQTPRTLFPGRRIGYLREGWEASFVVLAGNPLEDLEQLRHVTLGVKRGRVLERVRDP